MTMDQMMKDEELIREKMMGPQFAEGNVFSKDAVNEIEKTGCRTGSQKTLGSSYEGKTD